LIGGKVVRAMLGQISKAGGRAAAGDAIVDFEATRWRDARATRSWLMPALS
jgi:hypothetical protein